MSKWKQSVLKPSDTMGKAIKVLDREQLRIIMVSDKEYKLLGTITDGDIRRGLLNDLTLDSPLSKIMFSKPIIAGVEDSKSAIFSVMKANGIMHIPILSNDRKIIGIETLENLINAKKYNNPVFLMAGGFGTRLDSLTKETPKPLLKLGKKPILEIILEQFVAAGFKDFYISTHYKPELIRRHFGDGHNWGVSIKYIHEKEPLGTAGALALLPDNLPNLPIIMMNGDLLTKINLRSLMDFHNEHHGEATMCVREYNYTIPYGVVNVKDQQVISIEEKPVQNYFVNAGIYVLNPQIISNLKKKVSYLDMPYLLEQIIKKKDKVNMFPIHEYWLDIGQIDQYEKAKIDSQEFF